MLAGVRELLVLVTAAQYELMLEQVMLQTTHELMLYGAYLKGSQ